MKILDMIQGGDLWKRFRRTKIGSSDCPVIVGKNPWKSPLKLWEEKVKEKGSYVNKAMMAGTEWEPSAREAANKYFECTFFSPVLQHDEHEFMIASIDGMYGELMIEIKCPGEKVLRSAFAGDIPEYWFWQMQHQLVVRGVDEMHLFVYNFHKSCKDLPKFKSIKVKANVEMQTQLIEAEREFYRRMVEFDPPPSEERDIATREDERWRVAVDAWKSAKQALQEAEIIEQAAREALVYLADDTSTRGYGLTATRYLRAGSVDYKAIPQLAGVDLRQYRKPEIVSWRIKAS